MHRECATLNVHNLKKLKLTILYLPGLCPGITQLQQETSTVCIHFVQSILGDWHLFSAYFCNITIFYETSSFIFFFVLFYSLTYCKPFLNIRMGTSCQLSLHDNNIYWYEMFWVRVVSLVSLIECVPRYPGGSSPDLPTTATTTTTNFLLRSCFEFEFHRLCLFRSILTGEIVKSHIVIGANSKTKIYTIHKV